MARLLPPVSSLHPPSSFPSSPQTFTYVSDGDLNDVLYYLGTNFGLLPWSNPHTAGRVTVSGKPPGGGGANVATLCDQAPSSYSTGGTDGSGNEWFTVDFGPGRSLLPSKFSYRYRNDGAAFAPTDWKWEGSHDNSSWDELADVPGQIPVESAWVTTDADVMVDSYQYIRFRQIGTNNNGTSHVSGGEIQLYGVFSF